MESTKVVVTDQKVAWEFTDWLDGELCRLCWEAACGIDVYGFDMSFEDFECAMYEKSDVGALRDAVLGAVKDVTGMELVFDYPC